MKTPSSQAPLPSPSSWPLSAGTEVLRRAAIRAHQLRYAGWLATDSSRLFEALHQTPFYRQLFVWWLNDLDLDPGSAVDLGCGPGGVSELLAQRGHQTLGIDQSAAMIRRAKQRHPDLHFAQGSALELPIAAGSVAAVVSASLLNVVSDPVALLGEAARVLAPGGIVSSLQPHPDMDAVAAQQSNSLSAGDAALLEMWSGLCRKPNIDATVGWFEKAGFAEVTVTRDPTGLLISVRGRR